MLAILGRMNRIGDDIVDIPQAEEIRGVVEQIVLSSPFRRSPQLVAFLRFVVEVTLGGRAEYIKSYTIGVDAFGRGEGFDPQVDPIVRVEAARLRRALANCFAHEGAGLAITIEIPRGAYVPVFHRRKYHRSIAILISSLSQALRIIQAPPKKVKTSRLSFLRMRLPRRRRASEVALSNHAD